MHRTQPLLSGRNAFQPDATLRRGRIVGMQRLSFPRSGCWLMSTAVQRPAGAEVSEAAANLPMEIKLLILSHLDDGPRTIVFNCTFPSGSNPGLRLWLSRRVRVPILLHICHETRRQALRRYSSFSGAFEHFRFDFARDTVAVVEKRTLTRAGEDDRIMPQGDLSLLQRVWLHPKAFDGYWYVIVQLGALTYHCPRLRAIGISASWEGWYFHQLAVQEMTNAWIRLWQHNDNPPSLPILYTEDSFIDRPLDRVHERELMSRVCAQRG